MNEPVITQKLDGKLLIFDDVFSPPQLNELVMDVQNFPYLYGEVDDSDLPPTGMSTGDYQGTKTFHALWNFIETYVAELHGMVLKRSHANIFAPRESAFYHVDDENEEAWTFMFYANNNWDINEGGETKFITNLQNQKTDYQGTKYPDIISVPPIPGRMLAWKSNLLHTATPFRDKHRFTPTFKFVKNNKQINNPIIMGDEMTYPWKKDYVAPNPIKEKIHTIVSIDVFETTLPNVNNKEMLECISSYDNERIDPNPEDTHYEDFKFPNNPCCINFMKQVEQAVQEYTGDKDIELSGIWTHKTEPHGSTAFHSHTSSKYSFVYYPEVCEGQGSLHFTVFVNDMPRFEKVVEPKEGMLLIFDSRISHYTGKNVSGKDRYSISGNFNTRSKNEN